MTELKPCPFCGGEVYINGYPAERKFVIYHRGSRTCHFMSFEIDKQTVRNIYDAVAAWNKRGIND